MQNLTNSFHRWTSQFEPSYSSQKNARSFGKFFSSPPKVLNGTTRLSCPDILPHYRPSDFFPFKSSHCALHDEFQHPRCVRKTATFPSGTLWVPSSALLFDLEVPFLSFTTPFFPVLFLRLSRTVHARLYFFLFLSFSHFISLLPTSRATSLLFFSLFHRLGITASPRGEDVSRRRSVRLNIDYARFETRVMREADRVTPLRALRREQGKKQLIVRGSWETGKGDGRDIELTAKSFPIRWGTIRRWEWWAHGRVEKAIC